MRIVNIIGGLGNQMWQYAMLIALREKFKNEDVYYNTSFFSGYPLHNGFELERIFNITAQQSSLKDIRKVYYYYVGHYFFHRLYTHYFPILKTEIRENESRPFRKEVFEQKGDYYYNGYWADYRYFDFCRNELLKEFTLKKPLDERNLTLLSNLKDKYICSIHVRRGDFLKDPDFVGICDLNYYRKAIEYLCLKVKENITFLVFSNDITWCRENLFEYLDNNEVVYVDWNKGEDSYKDLILMTQCNANIIANSSFSWWGAYLNEIPQKVIISPLKFKNTDMGFKISLDNWICM